MPAEFCARREAPKQVEKIIAATSWMALKAIGGSKKVISVNLE